MFTDFKWVDNGLWITMNPRTFLMSCPISCPVPPHPFLCTTPHVPSIVEPISAFAFIGQHLSVSTIAAVSSIIAALLNPINSGDSFEKPFHNFIKQTCNHNIVEIYNSISSTHVEQRSIGRFWGFYSNSLIDQNRGSFTHVTSPVIENKHIISMFFFAKLLIAKTPF